MLRGFRFRISPAVYTWYALKPGGQALPKSRSKSSRLSGNSRAGYTKLLLRIDFRPAQGTQILNPRRLAIIAVSALVGACLDPSVPREASASVSSLDFQSSAPVEILLAQRAIADSTSDERATNPPEAPYDSLSPPEPKKSTEKSPGKAFAYNLVIPG